MSTPSPRSNANIVKAALGGGDDVRDLVLATGLVDPVLLEDLLHPERLAGISPGKQSPVHDHDP